MTAPIMPSPSVPSSPGAFTGAVAGGQLGKNEFIKLLVAQMQNQDPLSPMDGQQMAAQLAQFSSVEQLMSLGTKLDEQSAAASALLGVVNNSSAIGLIGKTVSVLDDQIFVGPGGTESVDVDVPTTSGAGRLQIMDASGIVLREIELGNMVPGEQSIALNAALRGLPSGNYRVGVDVTTADGTNTPLQTRLLVRVDGVKMSASGAHVTSGPLSYPIGLVDTVRATLPNS
jgi:flagellar basal-body rod modification protein FlgD